MSNIAYNTNPKSPIQTRAFRVITGSIVLILSLTPFNLHRNILSHYEKAEYNDNYPLSPTTSILSTNHPTVLPTDRIYDPHIGAFVLEEYKLIFVSIPKVACSEWKRMFMRMLGNPLWCKVRGINKIRGINPHDPNVHKIPYLSQYPVEVASEMMISPEWTKAIFVREPKERVLSAFLDKAVNFKKFYTSHCCEKLDDPVVVTNCVNNTKSFPSFLHYVTKFTNECADEHWEPQSLKIDSKWWPYFNFIGYQHNLQKDAERLLSIVRSDVDGRSAWERLGSSGWGDDNEKCENRTSAFLQENTSTHRLETGKKLALWYDAETEALVEKYWKSDWDQKEMRFPQVKLYHN